jgi:hypothetical protein
MLTRSPLSVAEFSMKAYSLLKKRYGTDDIVQDGRPVRQTYLYGKI